MKRNIPVSIRIAGLLTILVVLASGFSLTGFGIDKALAATPKAISIPKAWGSVKSVDVRLRLVLEDSGGVIRFVHMEDTQDFATGKISKAGTVEITITRN